MVGVLEEKNIKKINCCKSCVEFKRCGYCKFFNTFIDAQDEACSYYEVENCSNCEHWKKIKMGSESQSYGECALGETNTLSHPNITFEDFHCSKQKHKKEI